MLIQLLKETDPEAYSEVIEWLEEHPGYTSQDLWEKCERGDWMLGLCALMGLHPKSIISAAMDCTKRALKHIPKKEKRVDAVFDNLQLWLKGEITNLGETCELADTIYEEVMSDPYTVLDPPAATLTDALYEAVDSVALLAFAAIDGISPAIAINIVEAAASATAFAEASEIAVAVDISIDMAIGITTDNTEIAIEAIYEFSKRDELKAMADTIRNSIVWEEIKDKVELLQYSHFGKIQ